MIPPRPATALALLSLAAAAQAQPMRAPAAPPPPTVPAAQRQTVVNGIVARVEQRIITIDDVYREMGPLISGLEAQAGGRNTPMFAQLMAMAENDTLQNLVDRVLLIKKFRTPREGAKEAPKIPASYVDGVIERRIENEFEGDRGKFHAWLQKRGQSLKDFRTEMEEFVIVEYQKDMFSRSRSVVSPVKIQQYYDENKEKFFKSDAVVMRILQIPRAEGKTEAELIAIANTAIQRVKDGAKFEDMVRLYGEERLKANGGLQSVQSRENIAKEFAPALFESKPGGLDKGEMTVPVAHPAGIFVLYVEERTRAGVPPIDEVRADIEQLLVNQMAAQDYERMMEGLRRKAFIQFF